MLVYTPMSSTNVKAKLKAEADSIYAASISSFGSIIEPVPNNRIRYVPRLMIILIILIPFILGKLRYSFITFIMFAYAIDFVYNRQIFKFTRCMNNLVYKESMRMKAYNNYESVEWMNHIISRVWGVVESEISRQVISRANILLQEKTPQFISSIKLSSFTLGSSAPHVLGITHFDDVDAECICVEAEFAFIPMEIGKDAYHYVTKRRCFEWNSKIVLTARLGSKVKGVGVNLQILVKKISVKGRIRFTLKLCSEKIFKSLEIMFVDKPEIDFDLVPLKTVDLMDVPGLSKWIGFVIDTALKSMINPNSLVVDLTKPIKKEVVKGVLFFRISNMIMKEEETVEIALGVDGRSMFHTSKKTGTNIFFNEYFFIIVMESDDTLFLRVKNNSSNYGDGKVSLGMICDIERHCEAIRIYKKGNLRGTINCSFKLYKLENDLKIQENIKPVEKPVESHVLKGVFNSKITSSIVNVKVIQCEDLRGLNYNQRKVYSTFFTLLASSKIENEKKNDSHPFSFVTGPVNATALIIGGALSTATNAFSAAENKEETLPSSTSTFFVYESKVTPDTNSPLYNEQTKFFSRDLQKDYLYIRVTDADNSEVIGNLEIKVADLKNEESWHRLKNAQRGRIKLCTEMVKIKNNVEDFIDYKRAVWIRIKEISSIYHDCVMYGIVKTESDSFYIEPFFTGDLQNDRDIILPVKDSFIIKIYKMGEGVDDLIGEAFIDTNNYTIEENDISSDKKIDKDISNKAGLDDNNFEDKMDKNEVILPLIYQGDDNGSIKAVIKTSNIQPYKGTSSKLAFKVVQVRFKKFYNMKEEFLVEFINPTETIAISPISRNFALSDRFLLLVGDCEIRAIFKSANIGINKVIGDCLIPKRAMKERVIIDEGTISVDIEIQVHTSDFPFYNFIKIGVVELKMISAVNLPPDSNNSCDPFLKIFLNGNRIHKTNQIKKTLNPTFNESINIKINSMVDIIRIEVFDWNQFEKNKLIAYREMPLYFLKKGKVEYNIRLINAETFKPDKSKLKLSFDFLNAKYDNNAKVKGLLKG